MKQRETTSPQQPRSTPRTLLFAGALALLICLGALAYAIGRDDGGPSTAPWSAASCRDTVSTPRFAGPIAAARPLVSRLKSAFAAPGLQVAVAVDGTVVWSRLCGFADLTDLSPVRRTTVFRIGSVSKVFTAAALARLVQTGTVALDANVQRYLPSFPRNGSSITIAQLASHQAGIRHYQGSEALNTDHYDSVRAALEVFADDPLSFPPGSDHSYSSYGFNLLGASLESAAGANYAEVLRHSVLSPIGLSLTRLDAPGVHNRAALYEVTADRRPRSAPRVDLSDRYPSGGLLSTAVEVARLGSRLGAPTFLEPETQETFFQERRPANGRRTGYGLGFEVAQSPLGRFVGHTGNVVGGTAFLLAHPGSRVAIAMTTNIGWVTATRPPELGPSVPDPPRLLIPFIQAATR